MAARKAKKLICSMEGKTVVAYGRMPSPALHTAFMTITKIERINLKFKEN